MNTVRILLLAGAAGHLLCGYCDCLLVYVPGGKKFDFTKMNDNEAMKETFAEMPLSNPARSMVLGCMALLFSAMGYFGLYLWMRQFSAVIAGILLGAAALFVIPGTAHHVFCGTAEWFYVRMGMSEDARAAVVQFFKETAATMVVCYLGLAVFGITLFAAVVSGRADLPRWACLFNSVLLGLLTAPLRIGGMGNWCGTLMFLGMLVLIP